MRATIRGYEFASGQIVDCLFEDGVIIRGSLHVMSSTRFFICHDHPTKRHGSSSPEMYGHLSSWVFNYQDHDTFSEDVVSINPAYPSLEVKAITISQEFKRFLDVLGNRDIEYALRISVKSFEQLNSFAISDKPGYIFLSGEVETANGTQEKKVEIKLSRYIKKIATLIDKSEADIKINDSLIEKVYNKYVAYQKGENFKLEILKGQDILRAYTSSEYVRSQGTLRKSCMSDKLSLLRLYTDNKEISLATLSSDNGFVARCLIWEIDGKYYFDRIYYSTDWIEQVLEKLLLDKGYTKLLTYFSSFPGEKNLSIKLQNTDYDVYPYLDSFKYLLGDTLYYRNEEYSLNRTLPEGKYKVLVRTGGTYDDIRINTNLS